MVQFLRCFPVVLSLCYLIPRFLKARCYWTKSTLPEGFRPLFGLVYVTVCLVSRKIGDIMPVLHMGLGGTEFETKTPGGFLRA